MVQSSVRDSPAEVFYRLQANLWSTFIIEISEDKHRYLQRNFIEKIVCSLVMKWKQNVWWNHLQKKMAYVKSFGFSKKILSRENAISELLSSKQNSFFINILTIQYQKDFCPNLKKPSA